MVATNKPTLAFHVFGCRLNQAEAECWQAALAHEGYPITSIKEADILCVHSCAVTEPAVKEVTRFLKSQRTKQPHQRVVLSGCAANLIHDTPIDLRIPHEQKTAWLSHFRAFAITVTWDNKADTPRPPSHRTRASLIVQDGCDHFCAYCIVPHVRGEPVSEPAEHLLKRAEQLFAEGYREIVLTGCHLALYKDPTHDFDFVELLKRLCDIPGEGRFRIGSLEPCILDDAALIRLIATSSDRICRFLHYPMQTADDTLLRHMYRRYTQADLRKVLECVCTELPMCGLSADWIAGLPGETPEAAETTAQFLASYPFTGAHVFPYSKREGTPAATFPNQVPPQEILRRAKRLRDIAAAQQHQQLLKQIGRPLRVIPEQAHGDIRFGWSSERFRCQLPASYERGQCVTVTPTALEGETLIIPE